MRWPPAKQIVRTKDCPVICVCTSRARGLNIPLHISWCRDKPWDWIVNMHELTQYFYTVLWFYEYGPDSLKYLQMWSLNLASKIMLELCHHQHLHWLVKEFDKQWYSSFWKIKHRNIITSVKGHQSCVPCLSIAGWDFGVFRWVIQTDLGLTLSFSASIYSALP